jgi:hypothetical protein
MEQIVHEGNSHRSLRYRMQVVKLFSSRAIDTDLWYLGGSPSRPGPIGIVRRHHPNRRPDPIPHRHPRLDLYLAISDTLTEFRGQPRRLDWVDDLSSGGVGNAPAIEELGRGAGTGEGEVDGIAVLDLTGF